MIVAVALGTLLFAAFAGYAPRLSGLLPPRSATYLLVVGAVATTAAVAGVLLALGATAVAQVPAVAALGDWSLPILRRSDPVPLWAATGCAVLLAVSVGLAAHRAAGQLGTAVRLRRACRRLGPPVGRAYGSLIVVDSDWPEAFATPVDGGRIVVTTGLLRALPGPDRAVLLAHEGAHLRHRHTWWVLAADLCAAANPALRGVARATSRAVERWADETAAATVGDRGLAARALARAALHVNAAGVVGRARPAAFGVVDGEITQRVHALLAPPPRPRSGIAALLVLLLLAGLACAVAVQRRTDAYFDLAGDERAATTVLAVPEP